MRNILTYTQKIQLADAVRASKERYLATCPTIPQVARELSQQLGFSISVGNLYESLKALNIHWKPKRSKSGTMPRVAGASTVLLAQAMLELANAYGVTLTQHDQIKEIAESRKAAEK